MKTFITVICIAQRKDGKFLALQRAKSRTSPGMWNFVTGFIQERECAEDAALRELKEETNLTGEVIKSGEPHFEDEEGVRWVVIPILVKVKDTSEMIIDKKESQNYKWIDRNDTIVHKWMKTTLSLVLD